MAKKSVENFIKQPVMLQKIVYEKMDVGDMTSVRNFAKNIQKKYSKIDLLINNGNLLESEIGTD